MSEKSEKPDLLEQLAFSLYVIGEGYTLPLSAHHEYLLQLKPGYVPEPDIKRAACEILFEIISSLLPRPQIDWRIVTVELLRKIHDNDGALRPDQIALPEQVLAQLEKERIIRRGANAVVWGMLAHKVMQDFDKPEEKDEPIGD